jgi:hypothetical protein
MNLVFLCPITIKDNSKAWERGLISEAATEIPPPASATLALFHYSTFAKAPWVSVFKPENASPPEIEFSSLVSGRLRCSKSGALVIPLDMTVAQPGRLAQSIFPLPC